MFSATNCISSERFNEFRDMVIELNDSISQIYSSKFSENFEYKIVFDIVLSKITEGKKTK